MKKLLGLALILAALAVVTMGVVGFPKLDVNIWPLFPVLLFAFFTLEKRLQGKCYLRLDRIYDRKCDLRSFAGLKWSSYHSRCARLCRSKFSFTDQGK